MYLLYYKLDKVNKTAPAKIDIKKDYELGGETEATSRAEAVRKWIQGIKDYDDLNLRAPTVGDVVEDPTGKFFILAPQGIWALVKNIGA
jgi:hypothetical protein